MTAPAAPWIDPTAAAGEPGLIERAGLAFAQAHGLIARQPRVVAAAPTPAPTVAPILAPVAVVPDDSPVAPMPILRGAGAVPHTPPRRVAAAERPTEPAAFAPTEPTPAVLDLARVVAPLPHEVLSVPASFAADPSAPDAALGGIPARQAFAPVVHHVAPARLVENGLIDPTGPVTGLVEEFRIIKRALLQTAAEARAGHGPPHAERVLVCSAHPGEGKTFCAVNLALSIAAEKDHQVLLVDADVAKPSVLTMLGLPGGPGLLDALADPELAVETCVMATDIGGLSVLPAGRPTGHDTEYLASARTRDVLDRLSAAAPNRIVIFDSPPALAASPAAELARHVGQTLVVVRADQTAEAALRDCVQMLASEAELRLLLNATKFSPTGRRFGAYYGYQT